MFESKVPVLFIWKGKTLTTAHAKGYAVSAFPRSTGSSDEAAVRALQLVLESLENRHVMAIADHLTTDLKDGGFGNARVEGLEGGDWVLIDTGDVIVHIFRPEIREFYNIEKMWAAPEIEDGTLH